MESIERELKLVPAVPELLDTLAAIERLGPFEARGRRRELQRNSFFDSPSRRLAAEHVGFRRRTVAGQPRAIWTIKGEASHAAGVASRTEIELQLDAGVLSAQALTALRYAARSRGASVLADAVDAALASGLPSTEPYLETETDRSIVDLEAPSPGWQVELALDRMRILGHAYTEIEIEAELKGDDDSALAAIRAAIEGLGEVRESQGSKLSRAAAHVGACDCPQGASRQAPTRT
jgi:inorganic triphosphatase YgiF